MPSLEPADPLFNTEQYLKHIAIDNVIFGYHEKELKVLLLRPEGFSRWTLTGGYVQKTESLEAAADRIAFTRTGLKNLYLQQFRSFGQPGRSKDPEMTPEHLGRKWGIDIPADHWIFDHIVSIGFYTLTNYAHVSLSKGSFDKEIQWWPIGDLPPLMFDHGEIIGEALKALRVHLYHHPIGFRLLPEKFTLPEIHNLYETILGRSLDSRNFARRLMTTGIIKKLNETRSIGPHRSPYLYRFDKRKYDAALKDGMFLAL